METYHSSARLPLHGKGGAPAFVAKRRHAPSNAHLSLVV
jgi:hypothetical protein